MEMQTPPGVLVFSGSDPSGGAGMQADIQAISALRAHPYAVPTLLTVQDNVKVHAVHVIDADVVYHQARVLVDRFRIHAVKLGVIGTVANAEAIAAIIRDLKAQQPDLPVVLDPVLANTGGDDLSRDPATLVLEPLYALATILTPNLDEARRLCDGETDPVVQVRQLLDKGVMHVLLKGGHGPRDQDVVNRWYTREGLQASWSWTRLPGEFHGSGCTLAAALSACLAQGMSLRDALHQAQSYCQLSLQHAFRLAEGQPIPNRLGPFLKD